MAKIIKRYQSTIYGPYRVAYVRCGAITAVVLAGYVAMCRLLGSPIQTPETYGTDAVLLIALILFMLRYRKSLPDEKVTFKELMLFGLGMTLVATFLYGLFMWLYCGVLDKGQTSLFAEARIAMMESPETGGAEAQVAIDHVRHYSAFDWAFIGFFRSAVMGGLIAFFAAILLRTERAPVKESRIKNHELKN